jgi:alpha-ketoglutaric semialdehyde dehydrogenase
MVSSTTNRAGEQLVSTSPQRPDVIVAEARSVRPARVDELVGRARAAGEQWRLVPAVERAGLLTAAARGLRASSGELEELVIAEVGKPRAEARGEIARGIAILEYFAQQTLDPAGQVLPSSGSGLLYTERRARGVAGLITPWNFPIAIPLWKAAPAIAASNAVLLKPATAALGCAEALERSLRQVLPEGLFTVVPGERETSCALIDTCDAISFTGSTAVGRQVVARASERGIPVQAEMGGQNAAIVLASADVSATAAMLAPAIAAYAGQKCTATRRIIVVGGSAQMADALEETLGAIVPADPATGASMLGPVISEAARKNMLSAISAGTRAGAKILTGGKALGSDGYYVEPTLIGSLTADHALATEEVFAPLAVLLDAESVEQAVEIANGVRYGLVTSIHGRDLEEIMRAVNKLDSGMIKVNSPTTGVDFYAPFGGEKDSSNGPREQGKAALDFYSSTRTITFEPGPALATATHVQGASIR